MCAAYSFNGKKTGSEARKDSQILMGKQKILGRRYPILWQDGDFYACWGERIAVKKCKTVDRITGMEGRDAA